MAMLTVTPREAAFLGLIGGGCRIAFAALGALAACPGEMRRLAWRLRQVGGVLQRVQSDAAAAQMAAGAALRGVRAAAVVTDACVGACALTGLDDLSPVLVDVSGQLPLGLHQARVVMAPHEPGIAFDAGRSVFSRVAALRGPGVLAGLDGEAGALEPSLTADPWSDAPLPFLHEGPDNPDILLLSAGPVCRACARAREALEVEGVAAAHLNLIQISPFPGSVVAPALTSARRVLVVEPGGPGTLAGLVRSHLGAPVYPFGELPRLTGSPQGAGEIAWRAREVMAL